jgi:hypothetical protein
MSNVASLTSSPPSTESRRSSGKGGDSYEGRLGVPLGGLLLLIRDRLDALEDVTAAESDVADCADVFLFPFRAAVIRSAPPVGTLPSLHSPTTEGAGQIAPSGVARVSQKENMAVPASAEAASQPGVLS